LKPALRLFPAVLLLAAVTAAQTKTNPLAADPTAPGLGKGVFRILCAPCHGIRAQGGRGPDLSRVVFNSGDTDADLFRTIAEGVPGTDMGAYDPRLSEDNIWRIVAYIRSTAHTDAGPPVAGDPKRGEQLFWTKGGCGACHAVGTRGGRSGPDLTRVGRQRSTAYLRESVIDPGRDITPGYSTIVVVTRDGKKITGVERGLDNFTAQIIDLSGAFRSFDKGDVRSITREERSLMPANYGQMMNAQELDDVVAYLATLKGARR
jgi:putative heme-binding domain-containing protein